MPTKTAGRKTATKPKSRQASNTATARGVARSQKAKAKTATKASTNGNGHGAITTADVKAIVRKLKAGTTMTDIRAEYGAGPKIRKALMEAGYNTKGESVEIESISGSGKTLAARVAKQRENGVAWYALAIATGKPESVLRDLLTDNGYGHLVEGRVSKAADEKPAKTTTRKRGAAKAESAAKPAAKRGARRTAATKSEGKPAAKRTGRRVTRRPSNAA